MADVKWIKITTDIFDDEKILMIESLPSADSIIVIWFKLLAFAGKQNNSGVFLMNDRIAYTEEMLASIFRRDINIVRLALATFENYGMIDIIDNVITIPNWGKHQNLEQIQARREYKKEWQREYRRKQKLLVQNTDSECERGCPHGQNVDSLEEDIEEDKDIDKDIYSRVVSYLNEKAGTNYRAGTKKTHTCIHARLAEGFTEDDFKTVIDKKCAEWIGTDFEKFLRPETLFGTKFESYLNAKVTAKKTETPVKTEYEDFNVNDW